MFKYIIIGVCILLFTGCIQSTNTSYTIRERTRYYDQNSKFIGHSIKTSYGERYYNKDGHFIGYSK